MMVHEKPLDVASRPRKLIGRVAELQKLEQAIYQEGDACRVIFISGPGGLGKTRLLEEVLLRMERHPNPGWYDPPEQANAWLTLHGDKALICDLLDFADMRLQARQIFLETLGSSAAWGDALDFEQHEQKRALARRLIDAGAAYTFVAQATEAAEEDFWRDFQRAARRRRLVIPLDTTEQLAIVNSSWLLERGLLRPEEMVAGTQRWLLRQLAAGQFRNTTLLIAGRDDEHGGPYFDALAQAVAHAREKGIPCELQRLSLQPFTREEARAFFQVMRSDWNQREDMLASEVQDTLDDLLADEDELAVLHLYTNGWPALLSLYTDVIVQGQEIPEPLRDSYAEAQARVARSGREGVRQAVTAAYMQILFWRPGLRAQIMLMLVRAVRGLTAAEIHFVLDSKPSASPAKWQPDLERLAIIEDELAEMQQISFVKRQPGGRVSLQDEIYRLYAGYAQADDARRRQEITDRRALYRRLCAWSTYYWEQARQQRIANTRADLNHIQRKTPADVLQTRMPPLDAEEEQKRRALQQKTEELYLARSHYQLLLDPDKQFNDGYLREVDKQMRSFDTLGSIILQAEMWRVLHAPYVWQFIEISPRPASAVDSAMAPLEILRREAVQDDAALWVLRLFMTRQYERAIELAKGIEVATTQLEDEVERWSWRRRLARSQWRCWWEFARIYRGSETAAALESLAKLCAELDELAHKDCHTLVFTDNQEYGYRGHTAYPRLVITLANCYSVLGYGHTVLGDFSQAVQSYVIALQYMREVKEIDLQAITRNNLARALSELEQHYAVDVCLDALALRIRLGEMIPLAYSYNTLGLVLNNQGRPGEALEACGKAYAIVNSPAISHYDFKLGDSRATGLILVQVARSLRLLNQTQTNLADEELEANYRTAEAAVSQAGDIFRFSRASREPLRAIETDLEAGCLYRDWMRRAINALDAWKQRQNRARFLIKSARSNAQAHGFKHLELEALLELARLEFYSDNLEEAQGFLGEVEGLIPPDYLLPRNTGAPVGESSAFYYRYLSELWRLRGEIAFLVFNNVAGDLPSRDVQLCRIADAFVQSLGYAQLFAPHSIHFGYVHRVLYKVLKKLNPQELEMFYNQQRAAHARYGIDQLPTSNAADAARFLEDCFGAYWTSRDEAPSKG